MQRANSRELSRPNSNQREMDPATAGVYVQFVANSWVGLYKTLLNPPATTLSHQAVIETSPPLPVAGTMEMAPQRKPYVISATMPP